MKIKIEIDRPIEDLSYNNALLGGPVIVTRIKDKMDIATGVLVGDILIQTESEQYTGVLIRRNQISIFDFPDEITAKCVYVRPFSGKVTMEFST